MKLSEFAYDLPESLIAQAPCHPRDTARLLVVDRKTQTIRHDQFSNLHDHLPVPSTIILNNSRVIPARLLGHRETGGKVEIFLLKELGREGVFEVLMKPQHKLKVGERIIFSNEFNATIVDKDQRIVSFNRKNVAPFLRKLGHMPLPPYIRRADGALDRKEYQTVYAKTDGSVAAPTAGLHFTKNLLEDLKKKGHSLKHVTLHVNLGTFKPVETVDIAHHEMHSEEYFISSSTLQAIHKAKANGEKIVCVGTTSCRVLETLAQNSQSQGQTSIFIYPGFSFKLADILITNFHLPYSTLLMLVYAFGGMDLMKRAYQEAIDKKYRFYSYGDAMVIK